MSLSAQLKTVARSNLNSSAHLTRLWKIAFAIYAILLTAGTHWPSLKMGSEENPWPDKLMHMLAFGGLAFLFIQTRWIKKLYLCAIIAFAWTLFDEFSQSLPILGRESSWGDALSGVMGVTIIMALTWALGAIGGFANRLRLSQQRFLLGQLLVKPRNWLILIASALSGAVLIGGIVGLSRDFLFGYLLTISEQVAGALVAGVVGAVAAIHVALAGMIRRHALVENLKASCFVCDASCKDVQYDDEGNGKCPKCEAAVYRGQWAEPMQLPISAMLKGAGFAVGVAAALIAAIVVGIIGFTFLHGKFELARQITHAWNSWSDDFIIVIDLTAVTLIVAIALRLYRSRQARFYDRQDKFCRACDHDLQGTPIDRGIGRCPECGLRFARFV